MAKRLVVSRNAYFYIDRIIEFNRQRNQSDSYPQKFTKALFKEFRLIKKFPYMGIKTNRENVFLLVWADYYIYYSIIGDLIEIQSIRHQKEDISR